jgi:vacuolar-type H+-ATPase subunit F/Vma7
MSRVVALGEEHSVVAFAMVGVAVIAVGDAAETRAAWTSLPDDVGLVILTRSAADSLQPLLHQPGEPLWAVMP